MQKVSTNKQQSSNNLQYPNLSITIKDSRVENIKVYTAENTFDEITNKNIAEIIPAIFFAPFNNLRPNDFINVCIIDASNNLSRSTEVKVEDLKTYSMLATPDILFEKISNLSNNKNVLEQIKETYDTLNESNTKRTASLIEGLLGKPKEEWRMKDNGGYYGFADRWENVQNQEIQGQLNVSNLQGGLFKELYDYITTNTLDTVQLNNIKYQLEALNLEKHTTGNLGGYDAEQANVNHFKTLLIQKIQERIEMEPLVHINQNPNDNNLEQFFPLVADTLKYTQNETLTKQMNSVLSEKELDQDTQNDFRTLAEAYEKKTGLSIGTYDDEKIKNANETLEVILNTDTTRYDEAQKKDFLNALSLLQQHLNANPENSSIRANIENTKNQNIITEIKEKLEAKMLAMEKNQEYNGSHIVSAKAKNTLIDIKTKIDGIDTFGGDITAKNALWGQANVPQGDYKLPKTSLYGNLDLLYKNANTNEKTKQYITQVLTGISKEIQSKPDKEGAYRFINDTHKAAFEVDVENIKKEATVNVVNETKAGNSDLQTLFLNFLQNYSEDRQTDLENALLNIKSSDDSKNGIIQITREFLSQQNNNSLAALNGKKYILDNRYYLSIQNGQLCKSEDQGKTWYPIKKGDTLFNALKGKITRIEEVENFSNPNRWSEQQQQNINQQPKNGNNNNGGNSIIPANNGGGVGGNNNNGGNSTIPTNNHQPNGGNHYQQQLNDLSQINDKHRKATHERIALLGTQYGVKEVKTYNTNNGSFGGEITTGREFFEHTLSQVGTKEYEKQVKTILQTLIGSVGNSKLIADKLVKQALQRALNEVTKDTTYDTVFARVALELRIKTQDNKRFVDVQNCLNRIGARSALYYYSQPQSADNANLQEHLHKAIAVIARDMTNKDQDFIADDISNIGVILTQHQNYFFGNPTSGEIKALEDSVNIQPNTAFYNGKQDFINVMKKIDVMKKIAATTQLTWFTATGQAMTGFNANNQQLFNAIQGMNSANINVLNESLGELKNTNASSRETTEGTLHNMKNGIAQYGIIGGINTDNPNNPTLTNFFGGNGGMNAFLPNESKSHLGESPVNRETRYNNRNQMTREPSEESENNSEVRSNRRTPSFGGIQ